MKNFNQLYQLLEATDSKERLDARLRKRRQRDREDMQSQVNPFSMVLVVKNKMNGEILIIDKESYTPKYHEIVITPEKINQAVLKDIVSDPKFIQTETSKKLLGDIKADENKSTKEEEPVSGGGGGAEAGAEAAPQQVPMAMTPTPSIPFTSQNVVSGPMIALGMMGGMQSKDMLKLGVSEEELMQFNSSQEIQQISMKIAKDISFYFKNIIGRNILEYTPTIIKNQMFQTSDFWKQMGGSDAAPKTDIVFQHKCVNESLKNKRKQCAETMCGCTEVGIVDSERMITFTLKYGSSPILSGKMNHETMALVNGAIAFVDTMVSGANPVDIMSQFNEKEKAALEKLQEDIKYIKTITRTYYQEKIKARSEDKLESKLESLDKLAESIQMKIERVLNSNILYQEMILHEALTGYLKFGPTAPARAQGMIAIFPDDNSVAMDTINLDFIRKILAEDVKFTINMKSAIDISPDEKTEIESCKIRFGGKCPYAFTPDRFAIRKLLNSYIPESNQFKYSKLRLLVEKKNDIIDEDQFFELVDNAVGLMDLMNIFAVKPAEITIGPINFFLVASTIFSADRNIIRINDKIFKIPVQMDPLPVTDQEELDESVSDPSVVELMLERLINLHVKPHSMHRRDYRHEYKKFQASKSAKLARANRNRNRRAAERKHLVRPGDKVDIDHIDGNPGHNYSWNLHRLPRSKNRAKH